MLIITRKVGEEFSAHIKGFEIKFIIKKIRGNKGNEKVEILASTPPGVEIKIKKE